MKMNCLRVAIGTSFCVFHDTKASCCVSQTQMFILKKKERAGGQFVFIFAVFYWTNQLLAYCPLRSTQTFYFLEIKPQIAGWLQLRFVCRSGAAISQSDANESFLFIHLMEYQGTVTFPSRPDDTYRYVLIRQDDKLNVQLTSRKSKMQWESGMLGLDDFVPLDGVLPQATVDSYVTIFRAALDSPSDGNLNENTSCDLQLLDDDRLSLEIKLKLTISQVPLIELTPAYKFTLAPAQLDKLGIMELKILDQEDELAALKEMVISRAKNCASNENLQYAQLDKLGMLEMKIGELVSVNDTPVSETSIDALRDEVRLLRSEVQIRKPAFLHASQAGSAVTNGIVKWNVLQQEFFEIDSTGTIEFLSGGAYMVNTVICHCNSINGQAFALMKGDQCIQTCFDTDGSGLRVSSPLVCILDVKAHEKLHITFLGSGQTSEGGSFTACLLR